MEWLTKLPAARAIIVASVASALLVGGGIAVTLWSLERATALRREALSSEDDAHAVRAAQVALWQERVAMDGYLVDRTPEVVARVRAVEQRVDRDVAQVHIDSADERLLVRRAATANHVFVASFRNSLAAARRRSRSAARIDAGLRRAQRPAVAALARLRDENAATAASTDARADSAESQALVAGVIAGLLAFGAAVAFARYAVRLVGEIGRQNAELIKLDALKDSFVASVSHELRTPLTSIRGYLELVLEGEAGEIEPQQEEFLRIVDRNSERLLNLVGDLLFVAQIDAGQLDLELGECDLSEIAKRSVEGIRPLAEDKEIALELEAVESIELRGDSTRLGQLIDNLLSNAVKFTPRHGRVRISADRDGDHARLAVSDSGIGIPQAEQAQLFERFFRASTATERAIQGTGLGLSISKAIVDAHGGRIGVSSTEGGGTTFTVTLPLPQTPGAVSPDGFGSGSRNREPSRSEHRRLASAAGSRRTA